MVMCRCNRYVLRTDEREAIKSTLPILFGDAASELIAILYSVVALLIEGSIVGISIGVRNGRFINRYRQSACRFSV